MELTKRHEYLNVPNYISFGRIAAAPITVVLLMLAEGAFFSFVGALFFGLASASDMVDGFYARRYKIESLFGKFFDPLADKLLTLAAMIMLIPLGRIPAWFVVIILMREVGITMLRGVAVNEHIVIPASKWGKYKNAFGSFGVAFLILHYPFLGIQWSLVGWVFLIVSAVFSLGSGVHYVWKFVEGVSKEKCLGD